ncbi:MAG: cytochrome P450 [Candidatus Azotimanducaceae bacterium]|jgi:cytochrome P450
MSLKKKIFQAAGSLTFSILNTIDEFAYGQGRRPDPLENRKNPYSWLNKLRDKAPVVRSFATRGWMVLGFDAVQSAFTDPRFSSDMRNNQFLVNILRAAADGKKVHMLDEPSMLNLDAPDHSRLRKLVSHGFLRKYILSLEPNIKRIVDECLTGIDPDATQFDLMEVLAKPLPAIVIAELLGLPVSDREQFQIWSDELLGLTVIDDPEKVELGNNANNALIAYFTNVIAQKRLSPSQDLIGQLIAAEEEGDRLTAEEMYATCVLLLLAGHETTTRLIGNGMHSLLQHPDQLTQLQQDPSLTPNAVEEMLRYEPPVQMMPRFAKEDMDFHGAAIKKNQVVILVIASANRDAGENIDPDIFDIHRENPSHISFGYGIHLCLGLSLARLEAKVAIDALLSKFPEMTLAPQEVDWQISGLVRGMGHLHLEKNLKSASQ